jgi:long-subunit fatty acid transport protein
MKKTIILPFLVLLVFISAVVDCFALSAYNGYGGYSVGDTRIIGMGGAYIGVSEDINGILYNPAGLVYSQKQLDLKVTRNKINNFQTDLNGDTKNEGFPLEYWYAGILARIISPVGNNNIALGMAYAVPYRAAIDFDNNLTVSGIPLHVIMNMDLNVSTYSFPLAVELGPRFSLGAVLNLYTAEEIFKTRYLNLYYDYSQRVSKTSVDFGAMYWLSDKLTVGAVFKPAVTFPFDESMNYQLASDGSIRWFRSVKLPMRAGLGLSYRVNGNISINADSNYIEGQKDSELVGSTLLAGSTANTQFLKYAMKEKSVTDVHLGGNYTCRINDWLTFDFRGGGYFEPSRIEGVENRLHYTGGIQVYLWRLYTGLGYDGADDFENFSVIFGYVF